MTHMKTYILLFAAISLLCAQGPQVPVTQPQPVTAKPSPTQAVDGSAAPAATVLVASKEDQYHGRALQAELTNIQVQINKLIEELHGQEKMKEMNDLRLSVCGIAKIAPENCIVDWETGKVSEKPKPASPPVSK